MADNEFSPILNDGHLEQMKYALKHAEFAQSQIELAKRAGIDVSQQEKELSEYRSKILQVKNAYFPGR